MEPRLATILVDVFSHSERQAMFSALNDITAPDSQSGFCSAGVYAFWDIDTQDCLYVGLARDLALRFGQHMGLIPCDPSCCKSGQVDAFFRATRQIGYSIFVMSTNDQPLVARNKNVRRTDTDELEAIEADLGEAVASHIALMEGFLIRTHLMLRGKKPPWNKNLGTRKSQRYVSFANGSLLCAISGETSNPHVARCTIREFSAGGEYCLFEEYVFHSARLFSPMEFEHALKLVLKMNPIAGQLWPEIVRSDYQNRNPLAAFQTGQL